MIFYRAAIMKTFETKVQTKALPISSSAKRAIQAWQTYDWVLFTSKNAVHYFMMQYGKHTIVSKVHSHTSIVSSVAAVGPETAATLRTAGFIVTIISKEQTVKNMVDMLGDVQGKRILFPRSQIAPREIIMDLRRAGALVRVVALYTSLPVILTDIQRQRLLVGWYERISFTSPSGVHSLMNQFTKPQLKRIQTIPALCIGPTTKKAAQLAGFRVT